MWEVKTRPVYDCRCDERLEPKNDESTFLVYTGLLEELEYLKIETRLIDEKFASVMSECVIKNYLLLFIIYYELKTKYKCESDLDMMGAPSKMKDYKRAGLW